MKTPPFVTAFLVGCAGLAALFTAGVFRRSAAVLLWFGWACLFDRNNLAFVIEDKIELIPLSQFNYAMENGFIRPETLYFNNVVLNKEDLEKNWIIPVKDSWLARRIPDVQRFKGSKIQS